MGRGGCGEIDLLVPPAGHGARRPPGAGDRVNSDLLGRIVPFHHLDEPSLARLAAFCEEMEVPADRVIFHHGDVSDAFFVIVRGAVTVTRDEVGKPVQLLARLGERDFFGEQGLFEAQERSATVRTTQPTTLLRIPRRELMAFVDERPEVALRLQIAAAQRHSANAAVTLDLGRQSDVRIRLSKSVRIELADGSTREVELENLSTGGMSLSRAPDAWEPGLPVRFRLIRGTISMPIAARVTWRRNATIGLAFTDRDADHELAVWRALRQLSRED